MQALHAARQDSRLHPPQVHTLKLKRRHPSRGHGEVKVQLGGGHEVCDVEECVSLVAQLVRDAATAGNRPVRLQVVLRPRTGRHTVDEGGHA